MEDNKKKIYINKKVVLVAVIVLLISIIAPVSYAFFTSTVIGNTNANNSVVQSGTMRLVFTDGNVIGTTTNWIPGSSITKSFTVENTGTLPANYSVFFEDVVNQLVDKTDLVYTITGTTNGSNAAYTNATETQAPSVDTKIINNILIASGETHSYTITLKFLNKNENQDDNQNKSFTAKIQVYDTHNEPSAPLRGENLITKINTIKTTGSNDLEYDGVAVLGDEFGTDDNNLRYVGANPANYVYYNCSTTDPDEMNDSTCEKWRIIGIFNNIEKTDHTTASLVKLVRNESLGAYSWDTSHNNFYGDGEGEDVNAGYGVTQWGESTLEDGENTPYEGADLMRELNTDYLGYVTVGTDGYWYNDQDDRKDAPMPNTSLNNNAQSMIEIVNWKTGVSNIEVGDFDHTDYYFTERTVEPSRYTFIDQYDASATDIVNRNINWYGKVGLIYPSDYIYSTTGGNTYTKNDCLYYPKRTDQTDCQENSWLYRPSYNNYWTISASHDYSSLSLVTISGYGSVEISYYASYAYQVYPSLYLKDSVRVDGGDGTSSSPYKLII